jgi:hypothetical protein
MSRKGVSRVLGGLVLMTMTTTMVMLLIPIKQAIAEPLLQRQGSLENGDNVLQSDGSLYDEYTFEGQAGQQVTIAMESTEFDPYLIVLDENDQVVGENDDASSSDTNAAVTLTLPNSGTYRVIANSYDSSNRGRYRLTVNPLDQTSAIPVAAPVTPQQCQTPQTPAQARLAEAFRRLGGTCE